MYCPKSFTGRNVQPWGAMSVPTLIRHSKCCSTRSSRYRAWNRVGGHRAVASRSRIEMSSAIFRRLSEHAAALGVLVANADEARWIKRLSEEDADLMAKADVKATRKITRQMRAVQFQYNTRQYFAFFGLSPI